MYRADASAVHVSYIVHLADPHQVSQLTAHGKSFIIFAIWPFNSLKCS